MHYLTVHDLVWINEVVTGETVPFDYAVLEQAMAAQYGYGDSTNLPVQAANLLDVMTRRSPFAFGNRRTGYVALVTFLNANGFGLKVDDKAAANITTRCSNGEITAADAISELAEPADIALRPGVTLRTLVTHLCNEHSSALLALKQLTEGDE